MASWDSIWDTECRRPIKTRNCDALAGYYALLLLFFIVGLCGYIIRLRKVRSDEKRNKNCCCVQNECRSKEKRPGSQGSSGSKCRKKDKNKKMEKISKKKIKRGSAITIICDDKPDKQKKVPTCGKKKNCDEYKEKKKRKKRDKSRDICD